MVKGWCVQDRKGNLFLHTCSHTRKTAVHKWEIAYRLTFGRSARWLEESKKEGLRVMKVEITVCYTPTRKRSLV
jgi:hypothetical protein